MKNFKLLIRLITLITFVTPSPIFASFEDLGAGARAPGMSDVFVGIADTADAVYYNPAGLTQLQLDEISMHYGQLLQGADDGSNLGTTYLAGAHRLRQGQLGVLGFAYNNFKAQTLFSERTLTLSYGWKLKLLPFGIPGTGSLGVNLKQLHRQYEPDRFTENALNDAGNGSNSADPLFAREGYNVDAYAADLGALIRFGPSQRASVGAMLQNINQPDVSLAHDGDKAPLGAKIGAAYRWPWGLISAETRRISRLENTTDSDMAFAIERYFKTADDNQISVRGGYASGSRNYKAIAAGLSYRFSKARLDYAFTFPVSTLPGSSGNHRLGLSVQMGGKANLTEAQEEDSADLLKLFAHDALASHGTLTRGFITLDAPRDIQEMGLQLLVSKYPMDENSTKLHQHLSQLATSESSKTIEWPNLKAKLTQFVSKDDAGNFENALDILIKGDSSLALARMGLMADSSRRTFAAKLVQLSALGEMAAQAYRNQELDQSINYVRQILDILPQDPVVVDAYRKLLLMRTRDMAQTPKSKSQDIPEAPVALTAPSLTNEQTSREKLSETDALVKGYGEQLGYYFTRKAEGASVEERRVLLKQISALYTGKNIDLTLLNREIAAVIEKPSVQASIETKPAALDVIPVISSTFTSTPTAQMKKTPSAETPTAIAKSTEQKQTPPALTVAQRKQVVSKYKIVIREPVAEIVRTPELTSALRYYRSAVIRGISDHERIEILESIVLRFGEPGATEIGTELERIRKRIAR